MKVWAMTESEASTTSDTWTSNMKCGFLRMFTQKRSGRLHMKRQREAPVTAAVITAFVFSPSGENLIIRITSMNSLESGRHFTCESACLRCNRVQHEIITGVERRLWVYLEQYLQLSFYITAPYDPDLAAVT